jgi:transposase
MSNKREDVTSNLRKNLIDNYGIICFEKLNVLNMTKNHNLAKHILGAAWNKLVNLHNLQGWKCW